MTQSGHTRAQPLDILPLGHDAYAAPATLERFYKFVKGITDGRPYPHANNDYSSLIFHF
jgi:hypothetical protein